MSIKETPREQREYKSFPTAVTKVEADQGVVEHIVAVTGNIDLGMDRIEPGAFVKTLTERGGQVRVLDQHNTDSIMRVLGKPLAMREIGRNELPAGLLAKFPDAKGGLWARTQFLLSTPEGRGAFERIKSGSVGEFSIGYDALDVGFDNVPVDGKQTAIRSLKQIRLYEYSPCLWGMNPATTVLSAKSAETSVKAVVPFRATAMAPEGDSWAAPTLADFTDKAWGDLTEAEIGKVMACYAWTANNPPTAFGDLKLPHHTPSGAVVWAACAAVMARMNQAQIPDADMAGVRQHMAGHYKQFDKPMPGAASTKPVQAFKAADVSALYNTQLDSKTLWQARWQVEDVFDTALDAMLADEAMDGAAKLAMLGQSCKDYQQTLTDWTARLIAVSGKSAGEPTEVKVGRRLSTSSVNKIRAALAALSDLLGETPAATDSDIPEKDDADKAVDTTPASAPGPTATQAADATDSAKAGPGPTSPTDTTSAGTVVPPPTSNDAPPFDIDAEIKAVEAILLEVSDAA
jgi:HK97 family phage prohead protease